MISRNARGVVGAVVGVAVLSLVATGCADVPERTTAHAVVDRPAGADPVVSGPEENAEPVALVRNFVERSGNPLAAKTFLTEGARAAYPADGPPTIIEDTFSVVPSVVPAADSESTVEQTVVLRADSVGRLDGAMAFVPAQGKLEYLVKVRRQQNGQWRIEDPPTIVMIRQDDFVDAYTAATLYFLDPSVRAPVPDVRYVRAESQRELTARAVIDLLLAGPSETVRDSVRTFLPEDAGLSSNVVIASDGALLVPLTRIGELSERDRRLVAAQIVLSLREATPNRVRLKVDGQDLVPGQGDFRAADFGAYDAVTDPVAKLSGMVAAGGRLRTLAGGTDQPSLAAYDGLTVSSAAQSVDGRSIAIVADTGAGRKLWLGTLGETPIEVFSAGRLTRPAWLLADEAGNSNEVWTVQDGAVVVRLVRTGAGWSRAGVNATELVPFGTITDLRLSRDGTRVAVVANGQLVMASVVRTSDSVAIKSPRRLQQGLLTGVVGVDWQSQTKLVVATSQSPLPVVRMSVDGMTLEPYTSSNLTGKVTAITAARNRPVVVTDERGMSTASQPGDLWRAYAPDEGPGSIPFYPS